MDEAAVMAGAVRIALTRAGALYEEVHGSQAWLDNAFANLQLLEELGHGNLILATKLMADMEMTVVE